MEQVFDQCQQFEEKRLHFFREVLLDVKHHLNLTEDQRFQEHLEEQDSSGSLMHWH